MDYLQVFSSSNLISFLAIPISIKFILQWSLRFCFIILKVVSPSTNRKMLPGLTSSTCLVSYYVFAQ